MGDAEIGERVDNIVDALLKQGLAGALRNPAMRLAVQDQWVDGAADIVDRGVAGDFDTPGLGIDFNLADVKAMREGGDLAHHLADAGEGAAQLLGQATIVTVRSRASWMRRTG